jgi:hypothetical protein
MWGVELVVSSFDTSTEKWEDVDIRDCYLVEGRPSCPNVRIGPAPMRLVRQAAGNKGSYHNKLGMIFKRVSLPKE